MPEIAFAPCNEAERSRCAPLVSSVTSRRGARYLMTNPPWTALLQVFYARAGLKMPTIEPIAPESMPRGYRALLAHSSDMTPTLENFYGDRVDLTVLTRDFVESHYNREVVLTLAGTGKPVEYGVIRIHLHNLPSNIRARVLEEQRPFGDILQSESLPHLSWPQNFFKTDPDPHMAGMLRQARPRELYGRRNLLLDGERRLLAEVIEILAPVQAALHLPE